MVRPSAHTPQAAPGTRLLIVEDNDSLRQMMSLELEELGYEVISSGCCASARELIARRPFDLAVIDYHLPDGNGCELMDQIRRELPDLPVILCSGLSCNRSIAEARRRTGCQFVPKPITVQALDSLIRTTLSNLQPSDQSRNQP